MPKIKYELDYPVNASTKLLYTRLSTPSGLSEWFADDVRLKGKNFAFIWDGAEEEAKIILKKVNEYIKFKWVDDEEDTYFEFKITKEELTNSVSLVITDFAEEEDLEDSKNLWDQQVNQLQRALGV